MRKWMAIITIMTIFAMSLSGGVDVYAGAGGGQILTKPGWDLYTPYGIASDGEKIYVADWSNHRIQIFNADETVAMTLGEKGVPGDDNDHLKNPIGVVVDSSTGQIYVLDFNNNRIQAFDSEGIYQRTITLPSQPFSTREAITMDHNGHLFVSDQNENNVYQIDLDTAAVTMIIHTSDRPMGLATDSSGRLYVSQYWNSAVFVYKKNGSGTYVQEKTIGELHVSGTDNSHFNKPFGLYVDSSDRLYVVDSGNQRVQVFNNDGSYAMTLQHSGTSSLHHVASDNDGNIYVTDTDKNNILKFDSQGSFVSVLGQNVAPVFIGDDTFLMMSQGDGAKDISSLLHISDPDTGQTLTWTLDQAPSHGTVDIAGATAASGGTDITPGGTITYSPDTGYFGNDNLSIKVDDGNGGTATQYVTLLVLPPATDAPTANPPSGSEVANHSEIVFSSITPGAVFYYTKDGSEPTLSSSKGSSVMITGEPDSVVTVKVLAIADNMLQSETVSFTYTIKEKGTIAAIGDQVLAPLILGYSVPSSKSVEIINNGTLELANLEVSLSGQDAEAFNLGSPEKSELSSGQSTSVAISSKQGLEAGTFTATVTVSADDMTDVSFTVTQVVALPNAPASPQLSAAGGDRKANLTWSTVTDAVYYNVYMSTFSGAYDAEPLATVTDAVYDVQGLTNGTTYYFVVKAGNDGGESAASNEASVMPAASSEGGDNHQDSGDTSSSSPESGVEVLINGRSEQVGTAVTEVLDGRKVTTVRADEDKLRTKLDTEGDGAIITIPILTDSDAFVGELTGQFVKAMEERQAVLEIRMDQATYRLPAVQINMDELAERFGENMSLKDITVRVEIAKPSGNEMQTVEQAAEKIGFSLAVPPLDFKVSAVYGDSTQEVTTFNAYVERAIALPDDVDPSKITTGVVIEPDGTVRHVPTKIVKDDGKYFAVINSLTNSTYSVVWHPLAFSDMSNHWARDVVNDMGSRMVIDGNGDGLFSPDREITRAEFAAIIVRGLGIKLENGATPFSDVTESAWYSSAIHTAYAYHLISGFEDGSFRPNDKITREEAMVIIAKAMKITKLNEQLSVQLAESILSSYRDASEVSDWAQSSIADCLQAGVVSGRSDMELAAKADMTRAEVAAIVERLLQKSDLI
ncbi:S-layer homology domain-containing protein [Paenibacillus sp. HB172176]|uniref:S-layer homology domain-containing protein n=1 Tax=Paenibacillus sp. HB172176 TaxID=2493690 RepID=UPI0014396922|nr:S-layer homology domain-containing protein [Paenibacillus sp. HB172176]